VVRGDSFSKALLSPFLEQSLPKKLRAFPGFYDNVLALNFFSGSFHQSVLGFTVNFLLRHATECFRQYIFFFLDSSLDHVPLFEAGLLEPFSRDPLTHRHESVPIFFRPVLDFRLPPENAII